MIKALRSCTIMITLFSLILCGCSPLSDSNPKSDENNIVNVQVRAVEPNKSLGNTEEFPLPNCGGSGELSQSLGTRVSVSKNVSIGATISVVGRVQKSIPEVVKLQLQASIEGTYKQVYETANLRLDNILMKAAPSTHVIYQIQWEKQEYSSVVAYELNREILETPYVFILSVPKITGSRQEICPNMGVLIPPTPLSPTKSKIDIAITPVSQEGPFRSHYQVPVGDGVFSKGIFSDGLAPYSEQWLWGNNHFKIQRIRPEEYPQGCDIARFNTNLIWISGTTGMQFSVNGKVVGTYKIADDPHGYIFEFPVNIGDKLCAVGFRSTGYSIIIGPDIYYHYDSYCYRGNCK